MDIETTTIAVPAHYSVYALYGDHSALTEDEMIDCDRMLDGLIAIDA